MPDDQSPKSPIEKLREKQKQIAEQIKNMEARETERLRKEDTRRCVIAGRHILKHAELNPNDPVTRKWRMLLDEYLVPEENRSLATVNRDRALYEKLGIKPLSQAEADRRAEQAANDDARLKPKFEASKE